MADSKTNQKVVLVAMGVDSPALAGLIAYAKEKGNWRLVGNTENCATGLETLRKTGQKADGVLAYIYNFKDAHAVKESGLPAVNLSASVDGMGFPRVCSDDYAIGQVAAENLMAKNYQRLAIYWLPYLVYSSRRRDGFVETVRKAGRTVEEFRALTHDITVGSSEYRDLLDWLTKLRKPIGIFADSDRKAREIIQACAELQLKIPEDVAVLGVDNVEALCELCDPSLSSITKQDFQSGYQAAELLDKMMEGQKVSENTEILLPPVKIVQRASTDMLGIDSKKIATATKYIKENIHRRFKIEDIVRDLSVSRRWLQRGFNQWLGVTPLQYINQMRVERVKEYLNSEKK